MANDAIPNGDIKLLCTKIDAVSLQVRELKTEQKKFHEESQRILQQQSIQIALLEQQSQRICVDIEKNSNEIDELEQRVERQETINKIIGGLTAALYAVAAILGIRSG